MSLIHLKSGVSLQYRQIHPGDETLLQDFFGSLSSETLSKFLPHKFDIATLRKVTKRSENGDDLVLIVLDPSSSFVVVYGFLWHYYQPVPLLGIGIHEDWRRQGLGNQMINVLCSFARKKGCDGIELTTTKDNHAAFALYQSCGFLVGNDVTNVVGDGRVVIETSMYFPINSRIPSMKRYNHEPPE